MTTLIDEATMQIASALKRSCRINCRGSKVPTAVAGGTPEISINEGPLDSGLDLLYSGLTVRDRTNHVLPLKGLSVFVS